jgi:site-specific DNA recombinase
LPPPPVTLSMPPMNSKPVANPAKKLETRVLSGLKRLLLAPDLIAQAVKAYYEELSAERARTSRRRFDLERDLEDVKRRVDRIAEELIDTAAPALRPKLLAAEAEQRAIEAQLAIEPEPEPVSLNPRAADIYKQRVADLENALRRADADIETSEAIRSLISAIELTPDDAERDGWRIAIHGDLANLLALADGKPPAFPLGVSVVWRPSKSHSVGVGAGVGFEPTTFRL